MIETKEKLLYAKILMRVLEGDVEQMKLASLLGSRWMRKTVPLEEIIDLHVQSFKRSLSSKKLSGESRSSLFVSFQPLKAALKSYAEAYRDAVLSLNERSREFQMKADNLEAEVKNRTEELERSREDLERKVEEAFKNQETMLHMIEDLNRVNRELTATREKLKSSEKLAILGKLSLGLSHELRNPLGVIETSASVIERSTVEKTPDLVKWTSRIRQQTKRCNQVIESVLGFSMHDFRASGLFQADTIIMKAVKQCSTNGEVRYTGPSRDAIWINGDEEQLVQAVCHLIINALEATDSRETVDVRLQAVPSGRGDRNDVQIQVIDRGSGISGEDLTRIFEPFYSSKEGNLGLGLSLCNAIIRKHEGTLSVSSEPGKTCFTIRIPAADGKEPTDAE